MDNIFLFWEAISLACNRKQDFEKAYHQVYWHFLHGTLVRLGFPKKWVIEVFSFYRSAYSSVLLGGIKGDVFQMFQSVRRGCPLAPYLFVFLLPRMLE